LQLAWDVDKNARHNFHRPELGTLPKPHHAAFSKAKGKVPQQISQPIATTQETRAIALSLSHSHSVATAAWEVEDPVATTKEAG
jgi:hypothetical protein